MATKRNTETALVRACLDLLTFCGVLCWRNNTTGVYDPARKRFRTFQGRKGVSDILGVLPRGKFLAVECKVGKNKLSPEQELFLGDVERYGGIGLVVYELGDLESFLRDERLM